MKTILNNRGQAPPFQKRQVAKTYVLNNRGQASSTFQLLIAAIVAIAILGVLMSILDIIPKPPGADPQTVAKQLLEKAVTNTSEPQGPIKVVFDKDHATLSSVGLTASGEVSLSSDQLCFSAGEYAGVFDDTQPGKLIFTASNKIVGMKALCGTGNTEYSLDSSLVAAGDDQTVSTNNCGCGDDICCMLYLVKPPAK